MERRTRNKQNKIFDSNFFFGRVIDQITEKYSSLDIPQEPVVDLENMTIVENENLMKKRKDKDFGYFADNTLEDLRKSSYRDKSLVSTSQLLNETSFEEPVVKPKKRKGKSSFETEVEHHLGTRNTSTPIRTDQLAKSNATISKLPKRTRIEIEEEEQLIAFSPAISFERKQMCLKYIDSGSARDLEYQRSCAEGIMEILSKNNGTAELMKIQLVKKALEAWVCGVLPKLDSSNGTKIIPIIEFNSKGEPNWTFVLSSPNNSLDIQERINHFDQGLLDAFKKIYEIILPKNMDVLMNNDSIEELESDGEENRKTYETSSSKDNENVTTNYSPTDTTIVQEANESVPSTVSKNVTTRNSSKVTKNVQRPIENVSSKVNSSKSVVQNEKTKSSTKRVLQNKTVTQVINRTKEKSTNESAKKKTTTTKKTITTSDSGYISQANVSGLTKNGKKIGRPKGSKNKNRSF